MLSDLLAALQDLPPVSALRASRWVYPAVNALHIAGLALLFGAIVPMDLRLIGVWRSTPIGALARVLLPMAIAGLSLAVVTGALLFSVNAVEYAGTPLFQVKLLLIAAALANALWLGRSVSLRARAGDRPAPSPRLRLAGTLSIALWLAVIVAGRMLGYLS